MIQYDQVNYLVDLIHAQPKDAWVIVCGDFNFPRQAPVYEHMISQGGLTDALVDDHRPTYQPFPIFPAKGKWLTTLDYVLYRGPVDNPFQVKADIVPVVNTSARQAFRRFLTDHKALILDIR
jgi:endonuclease/exonuclease/phosphatase family metal-dependent hydrolase